MSKPEEMMVPRKPFFEVLAEIQAILGKDNPKIMAKVGMSLGQKFATTKKDAGEIPSSVRELFDWVANYLQNELLFAQQVEVAQDGNKYELKYGVFDSDDCQCLLCCGGIVKKKGGEPACPVSQLMMGAYRVFKDDLNIKSVTLSGIQKPASKKPGACDQAFIVETR
jgi:hypothetical protein